MHQAVYSPVCAVSYYHFNRSDLEMLFEMPQNKKINCIQYHVSPSRGTWLSAASEVCIREERLGQWKNTC